MRQQEWFRAKIRSTACRAAFRGVYADLITGSVNDTELSASRLYSVFGGHRLYQKATILQLLPRVCYVQKGVAGELLFRP
jgi:hypothetical protein